MFNPRALIVLSATCGLAAAQVPLSGDVYDGHGGPLASGTVYHLTGSVTVPAGTTLTVQPGAIVKSWHDYVLVDGTLAVPATLAQPAIFTSLRDDGAGGDTNGDGGASLPAPGDWYGLQLRSGSTTSLDHAELRYHGYGGWSGLYASSGALSLTATGCVFADGGLAGIDLNGYRPTLSVSGCDFTGNAGYAVRSVPIDAVPGFSGNTASGNGADAIDVSNASPVADASISGANCLGGALVLNDSGIIPAGVTLTLLDGAVVKAIHRYLVVDGTLVLDGTPALPVVFTSLLDDTIAGDTNEDGAASAPAPGDWYGLNPRAGSVTTLDNARLRYHGYGGWSGLHVTADSLTLGATDSAFSDGAMAGIDLSGHRPALAVSGCEFTGNAGYAVRGVPIDAVPGFSGNTASGNGTDAIDVSNASPVADATISGVNCLGGALVLNDSGVIPAGVTLSLLDGAVLKSWRRYLVVDGTLALYARSSQPVVLTSLRDDSVAGDTNKDGADSLPAPGDWYGINPRNGSTTSLECAVLRYHGYGGWSGLHLSGDALSLTATASTFADGAQAGIDLHGYRPTLSVTDCVFTGNLGFAVDNAPLDAVPGFTANTASGNGTNAINVANASPVADATIGAGNCLGGALVLNDSGVIPAGVTVTLEPGVVVKSWRRYLIVDGTLRVLGSVQQPVVLTSLRDDGIAGDTNGDAGATTPAPGDWYGLLVRSPSVGSRLERLLLRYPGYGGWAGLESQSGSLSALGLRIELAGETGLHLSAADELADVVVWAAGSTGVYLVSGDAVLRHLTSAANGAYGVYAFSGFAGRVESSVAWGNATSDWSIAPAGVVTWSDGLGIPAGTGNFAYDPLFRDASAGDLRMQYGSPCIDRADPAEGATGLDMAGFPRLMDGDLDLGKRLDMGAYEFDNLELALSANVVPGGLLDISTTDFAGFADCWLFVGTGMAETEAWRFGTLFVDPFLPYVVIFWPTVPATIPVEVPASIPVGSTFVMQLGARLTAAPATPGNLSNPVILTIE